MRHAASAAAAAWGLLLLAACAAPAQSALVLPITFQPIEGSDESVLFPLYANTSLFGAWLPAACMLHVHARLLCRDICCAPLSPHTALSTILPQACSSRG